MFTATGSPAICVGPSTTLTPITVVDPCSPITPISSPFALSITLRSISARCSLGLDSPTGLKSAFFAMRAHESIVPPRPIPRTYGGQASASAFFTASTQKSTISSVPHVGLSMAIHPLFSLPKPLGITDISTLFPSTISMCNTAGVPVPVFSLKSGSLTTDIRKLFSTYASRTPASTASGRLPSRTSASFPISTNTIGIPVSWHKGIFSAAAISAFSKRTPIIFFETVPSSAFL